MLLLLAATFLRKESFLPITLLKREIQRKDSYKCSKVFNPQLFK